MLIEILERVPVLIDDRVMWLDVGDEVDIDEDDAKSLIRGGEGKEIKKQTKLKKKSVDAKAKDQAPDNKSFFGSANNK